MQTEWLPYENWLQDDAEAEMVTLILKSGRISSRSHVLELGCGLGHLSGMIARTAGAKVFASEDSHILLEKAKAIEPDVVFIQGYGSTIPLQEAFFDAILIHQTSFHSGTLTKILSSAERVLKKDGRLLVLAETHEQMLGRITARYFPTLAQTDTARYPDAPELVGKAADSGFTSCGATVFGEGYVSMNLSFLHRVRSFGHAMLNLIGSLEYAEGLMRLEEDCYGPPCGFHHAGCTLTVLVREMEECLPLSMTA